ncbi:neural cell adhesion molecule 2-like [Tachysurus ichikawai]
MKWRVIFCTGENCVVSHLAPGTHYQLRYALMDSNIVTNYSEIAEFQTAYRDRPGAPTVLKQNKDSLYIAWQKAESDEDSPVLYYLVEYLEAGQEGWQSIQTEGPVCECRISLPYSTCYRARVSAVYRNRDISTPSDEMKIPVHGKQS